MSIDFTYTQQEVDVLCKEYYVKGKADGYSRAENDYHKQTEKNRQSSYDCGYQQGKADAIEELKSKADCDRCYECAMADENLDCMLGLKEHNERN